MEYKNVKTGATFSSPCIISGGDWVLASEKEPKIETIVEEQPEVVEIVEEPKAEEQEENTADFEGITKAQIMQELDAFGIEYNPNAKKQELYDLMMQGK